MKKIILVVLAVLLVSAFLTAGDPVRLVRFKVDNKSDSDVFIWLEGVDYDAQHYLTIPAKEKLVYTVVRTEYWVRWSAEDRACMKPNVIGLDYDDGSLYLLPYASTTLIFTEKAEGVDYSMCYGYFVPNWWYDWYLDHFTSLDFIY